MGLGTACPFPPSVFCVCAPAFFYAACAGLNICFHLAVIFSAKVIVACSHLLTDPLLAFPAQKCFSSVYSFSAVVRHGGTTMLITTPDNSECLVGVLWLNSCLLFILYVLNDLISFFRSVSKAFATKQSPLFNVSCGLRVKMNFKLCYSQCK